MSKKIVIPVIAAVVITLMAGLVVTSNVLAQGESPLKRLLRLRPALGQVTAIGKAEFTVETKDGTEKTFKVDDQTRYRSKEESELTFADLKTGQWVAVVTGRLQGASNLARLVITLPEGLDPTQFEGARGKVVSVNQGASQFTLENQEGEKTVVTTNSETIYRGEVTSLADLEVGMLAGVVSKEMDGNGLVARIVRAGNPTNRYMGEITKVNAAANTFALETRRTSQEMTFAVDENTRFRSKDNEISGLKDLKAGMAAVVVTEEQAAAEPGAAPLTAVMVGAADKADLPKVDLRVGGKIVSLDKNGFTIEGRDGKKYTFQVTGDTRFRSREVQSLADLKTGMLVMVGAKELGSSSYQAQVVLVLPRR